MAYIGKSPTGSGVRQRYVYTATGGETSLSGADDNSKTLKFTDGEYVDVHLNGIQLVQGTDYGVGTANTINGLAALAASDVVEITVYDVYNVAKINSEAMRNRWYYTATGGETSITTTEISGLSFPANAEIEVRLNGIALVQGTDFNTTTANTVGGLAALSSGNVIEIVYYESFQLADVVSKAAGGTYNGQVIANGGLDMNGKDLILDADGDSKIEASTDDTINIISGGTTGLTVDSSGRVLKPAVPSFNVTRTVSSTTGLSGQVNFDTVNHNIGSHYDTTNNHFLAPVAGVYSFSFNGLACNSTGGALASNNEAQVYIEKSTSSSFSSPTTIGFAYNYVGAGSFLNMSTSVTVKLNANDYVRLRVVTNYIYADSTGLLNPIFSGHLVG